MNLQKLKKIQTLQDDFRNSLKPFNHFKTDIFFKIKPLFLHFFVLKSSDNWQFAKRMATVEPEVILITVITSSTLGKYLEFSFI